MKKKPKRPARKRTCASCEDWKRAYLSRNAQCQKAEADKRILQQKYDKLSDEWVRVTCRINEKYWQDQAMLDALCRALEIAELETWHQVQWRAEIGSRNEKQAITIEELERDLALAKRQYAATVIDRNELRAGMAETVASMKRENQL